MPDPIDLRARVAHALARPGIAKTRALSWDEYCEERAASSFGAAVDEAGGNRACARVADCHESTIRYKRDGAKNILLKDAWKLPKRGAYRLAQELIEWADTLTDDASMSSTGS